MTKLVSPRHSDMENPVRATPAIHAEDVASLLEMFPGMDQEIVEQVLIQVKGHLA